jgi:hypothetical protein
VEAAQPRRASLLGMFVYSSFWLDSMDEGYKFNGARFDGRFAQVPMLI